MGRMGGMEGTAMTEKQAEVAGHEWTPDSFYACCSCGEWCCAYSDEYHGEGSVGRDYCLGQHAAHLAALASQVPAQPPAPTKTNECGHPAQCIGLDAKGVGC